MMNAKCELGDFQMLQDQLMLFTHIPKTGGTSFKRSVIDANISKGSIYNYYGMNGLLKDNLDGCKFVEGHYPYGIHKLIWKKCVYITLLREPLDHAISYYYFIKQCNYPNYKHPKLREVETHSLTEFWNLPHNRNLQTKLIAGIPVSKFLPDGSDELLSAALSRLKSKYLCYGILEKIGLFEAQVSALFGWNYTEIYEQSKKTICRPKVQDLKSEEVDKLKSSLSLDMRLYADAKMNVALGNSINTSLLDRKIKWVPEARQLTHFCSSLLQW